MVKISFNKRLKISQFLNQKLSLRQIATIMNRSPSSISEEIRRQGQDSFSYSPYIAQEHAGLRKRSSKRHKNIDRPLEEIIDLLIIKKRFSPE